MKNFRPAIIMGIVAVVVVIVTVLVVTRGNASHGMYITAASGKVTISSQDGATADAIPETKLVKGDVITVPEDSSCTLIYRTADNTDENYVLLYPGSQVFLSDDFKGKADGEIYLNRGTVLVNMSNTAKYNVNMRTVSSSYTTKGAVLKISCTGSEGEEPDRIDTASFLGSSQIQLYNSLGAKVDLDGNVGDSPEVLGDGLCACIVNSDPPKFDYLNIPVDAKAQDARTLKELITISAFHELNLPAADLKAAYDEVKENEPSAEPAETETQTTTAPAETTVTTTTSAPTESETTTTPVITTAPVTTTTAPRTTAQTTVYTTAATTARTTTAAVTTTTTAATTDEPYDVPSEDSTIDVYIIIDEEVSVQEVPYGGSATIPSVPEVEGRKFIGWDESFDNITSERTITAQFEYDSSYKNVDEDDNTSSDTGYAAPDPVPYEPVYYTVTFIVEGESYSVQVESGGTAVPPVSPPPTNAMGQTFIGWSSEYTNVNTNTTVYAIYA